MKQIKLISSNIYATILISIGWFLGALGGSSGGNKAFRRFALPILITGLAYLDTESILTLTILSMCGIFSMGYGIPGPGDEGSILGRFFYKITQQNHLLSDMLVRGIVGILVCLSLISLPIIRKNWLIYGLCSLGIILTYALISWRNLGTYNLFKKPLLWSETILYGIITLCAVIMIKLGGK